MQTSLRKISFAVLSVLIAACANTMAQQNVMTPQDVAREFWSAMVSKDIAKAKTFAKSNTRDSVGANEEPEIERINLQPSKREHGQSVVPTVMTGIKDGRQQTLSFNTVLVEEIGEWKVDFDKTTDSMQDSSAPDRTEGRGEVMGEAVGKDGGGDDNTQQPSEQGQ